MYFNITEEAFSFFWTWGKIGAWGGGPPPPFEELPPHPAKLNQVFGEKGFGNTRACFCSINKAMNPLASLACCCTTDVSHLKGWIGWLFTQRITGRGLNSEFGLLSSGLGFGSLPFRFHILFKPKCQF